MDNILLGVEDVPPVADDKCFRCGVILTKDNFSDWFVFEKVGNQMYQMPICNKCDKITSASGGKIE